MKLFATFVKSRKALFGMASAGAVILAALFFAGCEQGSVLDPSEVSQNNAARNLKAPRCVTRTGR